MGAAPTRVLGGSGTSVPGGDDKVVAVFGAESTHGFNVAMSLMEAGFKVKAAVGDMKSQNTQSLQTNGASVVPATLSDDVSCRPVLRGATHVYALSGLWCVAFSIAAIVDRSGTVC